MTDAPTHELAVERVPLADLQLYPGNARVGNVDAVAESIARNGLFRPLVVQRATSYVLAGNHTLQALRQLQAEDPDRWATAPVTYLDVDEDQARRVVVADNRTSDLADYDNTALLELLQGLDDLDGTGFVDDDLAALESLIADQLSEEAEPGAEDEDQEPAKGDLLALADVAVAEPDHQPAHGSTWALGRHLLVVARVSDEHHLWAGKLTSDRVLCPYPEPYITSSELAQDKPLLLVQPNRYLAGHLLDKHEAVYPGTVQQQ